MKQHELVLPQIKTLAPNWKRSVLIRIMHQLNDGCLKVHEDGALVGCFGDVHSELQATIRVKDPAFYGRVLVDGSIGFGESYIDGEWDSHDITSVIRVFTRNLPVLDNLENKFRWLTMPVNRLLHWRNSNSKNQAKRNISAHYDLGNRLYESFLDESMLYSSAIFATDSDQNDLAAAQENKMRQICEKLGVHEDDHVLEIGTGWGGLAIFMAGRYGCRVTTTTISEEQFAYATKRVADAGLSDRVTVIKKDYRELTGEYTKLVSIEMIEAVGESYLDSFVTKCNELLAPGGRMLLQAITIADQRMSLYRKSVDFIQLHVFPGGFLPSLTMLCEKFTRHSNLIVRDVHDIGIDYAQTLKLWRERFEENFSEIATDSSDRNGYDERFYRLWKFYLEYCEGGFRERTISTVQLVLSSSNDREKMRARS